MKIIIVCAVLLAVVGSAVATCTTNTDYASCTQAGNKGCVF